MNPIPTSPAEQLAWLRDPARSLLALGQVKDQKSSLFVAYDPTRITRTLQLNMIDYVSNTPRDPITGQTKWLTVLTARQMGKSIGLER